MRFFLLLAFLLTNANASAAFIGQGDAELGISQDNEDSNIGLGMRYSIDRQSSNSGVRATSRMQLGSDRGRSLVATAAHEYQYENSFIDHDIYHNFDFLSPRFNWASTGSHRTDFENRVNESTGQISTDYAKSDESWSITTGPSFKYIKGRWFDFKSNASFSRQFSSPFFTNEALINMSLAKSVSKVSQFTLTSSYLCAENDNPVVEKFCRSEASLGIDTQAKDYSFSADYGVSDDGETLTSIYSATSGWDLNSTSQLELTAYRVVDSIAREEAEFETGTATIFAVKEGRNAQYLYEWSRTRVEINARRLLSKSEANTSLSEDLSLFYDFQLSSAVCSACSLSLNYEYSRFDLETEQKITSLGIAKRNSRRISSAISFRRTERSQQETFWSINFLITYTGIASKISNR